MIYFITIPVILLKIFTTFGKNMKYHQHFFIIIYCATITFTSSSMEQSLIFHEQKKIITIENPRGGQYVCQNKIAIINKERRSYVLDLNTKKEQTITSSSFYSDYNYPIILSKNNKIITYNERTLSIYDIKTGEYKKKESLNLRSLEWDSSNNTIFFSELNNITQWNYNNERETTDILKNDVKVIAIQPEQKIICSTNSREIFLHDLNDNNLPIIKTIPYTGFFCLHFYKFSPDGSYLAIGNSKKIMIINLKNNTNKHESLLIKDAKEFFKKILFHPNNLILAILCTHNIEDISGKIFPQYFVRYYDIKTLALIDETEQFQSNNSYDIGFSPNGYFIIITLDDKCIELPVYCAIKEKCIHSLYVLNQFKYYYNQNLPKDVTRYIIKTLCNNIISGY